MTVPCDEKRRPFGDKDHIDEPTHTIKIPHELTKNKMQGRIVLSNTTWKVLQEYLREDRARLVKAYGAEDAGPLFLVSIQSKRWPAHKPGGPLPRSLMRSGAHLACPS